MALCAWWTRLSLGLGMLKAAGDAVALQEDVLVRRNGQEAAIPSWHLQSSSTTGGNLTALSLPGLDTATWQHVNTSRCTIMGCLLYSGVYNDSYLFFSDNIKTVDGTQFAVPWIYRREFMLHASSGQHFFLQTNGITSRADVYVNGWQVASSVVQSGAYGGHRYDITRLVKSSNALAVGVYPTDYMHDFALGFNDWNPSPADNGSGIWRNVTIKQTGPVALGPLRIVTQLGPELGRSRANVSLEAAVTNLEGRDVTATVLAEVTLEASSGRAPMSLTWTRSFKVTANTTTEMAMSTTIQDAAVWWPRQWGEQPLYTARLMVSVDGSLSDAASRTFGFRTVTSHVNADDDIMFTVNGQPFQVLGAGYTPDMFLRWDSARFTAQAEYMLSMGLNTVRLEGKMEQPELYATADRLGLMVLAGWECCDKWEAWSYNDNMDHPPVWSKADYATADASMRHEAAELQTHPCVLGFLVGSDFWPDDQATSLYLDALRRVDWQVPVVPSAAKRGHPAALGPSGMKMDGPYDWVPANYWWNVKPAEKRQGAAFGFGSEQGAGVGTPPLSSLRRFLGPEDLEDLWTRPEKNVTHMSASGSQFSNRAIYDAAMVARHGRPGSLEEYILKAQLMDYEATRAEFEAFAAMWNAQRPATGVVYWMLNSAWPSLHWALWDYYMHPAGAYHGAKVGCRVEHVAYDPVQGHVYLINRSLDRAGNRTMTLDVMDSVGRTVASETSRLFTRPNSSRSVSSLADVLARTNDVVVFLRLVLRGEQGDVLSRNVYCIPKVTDVLDWDKSTWFYTPVSRYADLSALWTMTPANLSVSASVVPDHAVTSFSVVLSNPAAVPAFFVGLNLVDAAGHDVAPVFWSDNYVTLWPGEKLVLGVRAGDGSPRPARVVVGGVNVAERVVAIS